MPDSVIGQHLSVWDGVVASWEAWGGPKLVAVHENGNWNSAIKISESPAKTPNPGRKALWRIYDIRGKATADLQTLEDEDPQVADKLISATLRPTRNIAP